MSLIFKGSNVEYYRTGDLQLQLLIQHFTSYSWELADVKIRFGMIDVLETY